MREIKRDFLSHIKIGDNEINAQKLSEGNESSGKYQSVKHCRVDLLIGN